MKVAFIIPRDNDTQGPLSQFSQCRILPPVGLARMAGMVGKKAYVTVVDERIDDKKHKGNAHIAVIFINSYNRQRAYDIANYYRNCGSTVVFTGPLLSNAMEDAEKYADALFVGDGGDNMPAFIQDYKIGKIKHFYRHSANSINHKQANNNVTPFPGHSLELAS
ncbi:hypothetical protein [Kaarinaea lacus]